MSNLTIVTAGTRMSHYSLGGIETLCGKKVVSIESDQRHLVEGPNYYGDDLEGLVVKVGCRRCQPYLPREERNRIEQINTANYKTRVANGTIKPVLR